MQRHREHSDVWPKLNAVLADDADRTATGPRSPGRVSPACCEESCLDAIERGMLMRVYAVQRIILEDPSY